MAIMTVRSDSSRASLEKQGMIIQQRPQDDGTRDLKKRMKKALPGGSPSQINRPRRWPYFADVNYTSIFQGFENMGVTGHKLCEKKRSDEWVVNVWWFDLNSQASTHLMFWGFDSPCHGASALGCFYGNSP
eukprot:g40077.t1